MEQRALAETAKALRAENLPDCEISYRLGISQRQLRHYGKKPYRRSADWAAAAPEIAELLKTNGYDEVAKLFGCHPRYLYDVARRLGINEGTSVMARAKLARLALVEKYSWLSERRAEWLSAVLVAAGIKQFTEVQLRYTLQQLRRHPAVPKWWFMYRERLGPVLLAGMRWWTLDNNSYVTTVPAEPEAVADPRDVQLFGEALRALWTNLPPTGSSSG